MINKIKEELQMKTKYFMICLLFILLTGCTAKLNNSDESQSTETPLIQEVTSAAQTENPSPSAVTALSPLTLTQDEYPRVDGSTATIPLGEAVAAVLMGKDRVDCGKYAEFTGTDSAYRRLAYEEVDLLIVYEASETTMSDLSHVQFIQAPIGADALVFLVNTYNSIDNLADEQIRDIYSG